MSNINIRKNTLSLVSLFLGTGLGALAFFAATTIIARNTTPQVFGNYSAILVIVNTLAPLCGFGIPQYLLKLFGQHGSYGTTWIKPSLIFTLLSTAIIYLILISWFTLTLNSQYLSLVGYLLSLMILKNLSTGLLNSALQIERRYILLSTWQLFQSSALLVVTISTVYIFKVHLDELVISILQVSITLISVVISIPLITRFIQQQIRNNDPILALKYIKKYNPNLITIMREAAPFGVASLFYLIYYQLGVVFVRYILGSEAAGYYSVAFTFLSAALLVPGIIYQKFLLPKLHRWAYHDREKFIQSYHYGNYIMLFLGVTGAIALWLLAPYLIQWFFGAQYAAAIPLVQLMALNIPIVYVASSAGSLLVTQDHMKTKVYYMGASALISLLLSAPMILYFGTKGAIYTNIICNTLLLFLYFRAVKKRVL